MIYSPRAAPSVNKSHIPSLLKNNPYLIPVEGTLCWLLRIVEHPRLEILDPPLLSEFEIGLNVMWLDRGIDHGFAANK